MCLELEKGITEAISTPCLLSMMASLYNTHCTGCRLLRRRYKTEREPNLPHDPVRTHTLPNQMQRRPGSQGGGCFSCGQRGHRQARRVAPDKRQCAVFITATIHLTAHVLRATGGLPQQKS